MCDRPGSCWAGVATWAHIWHPARPISSLTSTTTAALIAMYGFLHHFLSCLTCSSSLRRIAGIDCRFVSPLHLSTCHGLHTHFPSSFTDLISVHLHSPQSLVNSTRSKARTACFYLELASWTCERSCRLTSSANFLNRSTWPCFQAQLG